MMVIVIWLKIRTKGRKCQCSSWARLATFGMSLEHMEGRITLALFLLTESYHILELPQQ